MSLIDWMKLGGLLVFIAGLLVIGARLILWALDFDFFDFHVEDEVD
jgi:hypothetical protein